MVGEEIHQSQPSRAAPSELVAGVDLILSRSICYKMKGETIQMPLPVHFHGFDPYLYRSLCAL